MLFPRKVRFLFVIGVLFIFWALFWFFMNLMGGQPVRYEQGILLAAGATLMALFWPPGMTIDHLVGLGIAIVVGLVVLPLLLALVAGMAAALLCVAAGFLLWFAWMWLRWRTSRRR